MQLKDALTKTGIKNSWGFYDHFDIAELRNFCGSLTLQNSDISHLAFVDHDIGFMPQSFLKLLQASKPLIGAVYAKRQLPITPCVRGDSSNLKVPFDTVPGTGMGLALIARDVFSKLAGTVEKYEAHNWARDGLTGPLYGFFDRTRSAETGALLPEDYSFCERWKKAGGVVWALSGEKIMHVGDFSYELSEPAAQ